MNQITEPYHRKESNRYVSRANSRTIRKGFGFDLVERTKNCERDYSKEWTHSQKPILGDFEQFQLNLERISLPLNHERGRNSQLRPAEKIFPFGNVTMNEYVEVNGSKIEKVFFNDNVAEAKGYSWTEICTEELAEHKHCMICWIAIYAKSPDQKRAYKSKCGYVCSYCFGQFLELR